MIGSACRRHRRALAALAERSDLAAVTADGRAAMEHVDRCTACATTLGELMLTAMALRRMGADAAARSPRSADAAWRRLRPTLEGTPGESGEQRWRGRVSLNGLALSMLLLVVLVGPAALRFTAGAGAIGSIDRTPQSHLALIDSRLAADGWNPSSPVESSDHSQAKRFGPDSRPAQKEVSSTNLALRPNPR